MSKTASNEEKQAEGAEASDSNAPAKKSKKKLIIIVVVVLVLLGGVAGFLLMSKKTPHTAEGEAEIAGETKVELDEHGNPIVNKPVYYTLPEFLVNLNATGKSSQFLKATVVLEVAKSGDVALIEETLPRIVDGINTYLREMRSSDVAGSAGIQRLREEILLRVNKAIAPNQINDVLFKEIVVQ